MEKEGWGGEGRIYNIENDSGIIILRLYTARRVPPSGITAQPEASLVMAEKKPCSVSIRTSDNKTRLWLGINLYGLVC